MKKKLLFLFATLLTSIGTWAQSEDMLSTPLTLEAIESGTVTFDNKAAGPVTYRVNGGETQTIESKTTGKIPVNVGDKVAFYGDNETYYDETASSNNASRIYAHAYIYGNIMSLISSKNFENLKKLTGSNTFCELFGFQGPGLKNHPSKELELPATKLTPNCYRGMFALCISLTKAPKLPATKLASQCYRGMFEKCYNLTDSPELPATTLANGCYKEMFSGCTGLIRVPKQLPAKRLSKDCYYAMFSGCTGITEMPELQAETMAIRCYAYMFSGCSRLKEAKKLFGNKTGGNDVIYLDGGPLADSCFMYMFSGCTDLIKAPALSEKTLANYCYYGMFYNCKSLNEMPTLPATVIARKCYSNMFNGCTNLKTISRISVTEMAEECCSGMFKGCTSLKEIPASTISGMAKKSCFMMFEGCTNLINASSLSISINDTALNCCEEMFKNCYSLTDSPNLISITTSPKCYYQMFSGCKSLVRISELPATIMTDSCYSKMFEGCVGLIKAPILPATKLSKGCYWGMFKNCTNLLETCMLPATSLSVNCYREMFANCISLTKAPDLPAIKLVENCYQGMFQGCTSLLETPKLTARTLVNNCYKNMFEGCTNLTRVTCMATDISSTECTGKWLSKVSPSGIFVKTVEFDKWPKGDSGIPNDWIVEDDDNFTPLTLEAISEGKIIFNNQSNSTVSYRVNNDVIQSVEKKQNGIIEVKEGDKVSFYSDNAGYSGRILYEGKYAYWYFSQISCTSDCYIYGNIMSLLSADNYGNKNQVNSFAFSHLFYENTHLKNHPDKRLLLPATKLSESCYSSMFAGCKGLNKAPDLPATALADSCYKGMFNGCIGLIDAPILPATKLSKSCYSNMFAGCKSLGKAPELPATTLSWGCYNNMFGGCINLRRTPELPAWTLASSCYSYMFYGCTRLTEAPESLYADIAESHSYESMFENCINLTVAPNLAAIKLKDNCYASMFKGCTNLTQAPVTLPALVLDYNCYNSMFAGCISLTTAPVLPATMLKDGCYHQMFSGCINLKYVTCLSTDLSFDRNNKTEDWLKNVSPTGVFIKSSYMNAWTTDKFGIPVGWIVINEGDEIPTIIEEDNDEVMASNPLTIEAIETCSISFENKATGSVTYRINNGELQTISSGQIATIDVRAGTKVKFYGDNVSYAKGLSGISDYSHINCTGDCYVYGNIMSLISSIDFANATSLTADYAFCGLFKNASKLKNHPKNPLILPATQLSNYCYNSMFYGCHEMTVAPKLPAKELASYCYNSMFEGCTNLIKAPKLPATILADFCYWAMFRNCANLTEVPPLPATSLANSCYMWMFMGCRNLKSVTCLASDISSGSYTSDWLSGVSPTGTFTKAKDAKWLTGASGIPEGWTVVDYDPTGINATMAGTKKVPTSTYDLRGMKVANKKGLKIVEGRKVLTK